jgi:4-diphosphocytidyl-2C-methyl-D-erythritol kinase
MSDELAEWWDRLAAVLPVRVQLTGSGSGLFCLCDDQAELEACWDRLGENARRRAWSMAVIGPDTGLGG